MNKLLIIIIFIAAILRFYQLGVNPPSLTWDEASIGYNAYSILKTGADEYGNKFPLSIRSFDDYKPPLYVYFTVLSVGVFGLSDFSVRLPAAIIGVLSVIAIYFLVKELLQKWDGKTKELIALTSSFFLAISPWHLQFSRAAFEGNIGLFFLILGILLFLRGLRNEKILLLSSLSFIFSIYSYHSFRLLVPVFLLFLGLFFWQNILRKKLLSFLSFLLLLFIAFPVYLNVVQASGSGSRLSMVTIFSDPTVINTSIARMDFDKNHNDMIGILLHNRRIVYSLVVAKGYFDHFNPDFLFFHGDGGVQHHAVDVGMLYLWDLPFIMIGIYYLLNRRDRYVGVLFLLFLLAAVPSAITTGTPHPVRAIALMPAFHIFAAVGFVVVLKRLFNKKYLIGAILAFLLVNIIYYLHQYYIHTPIEYGYFWQYGYKDVLSYAKENEEKFDKIIMTYRYDQPYIYYLFYNKIDPAWYQKNWDYNLTGETDRFKRVIGKYTFKNIEYAKDVNLPNALLIGTPEEIPDNAKIIRVIKFPDGSGAFRVVKT